MSCTTIFKDITQSFIDDFCLAITPFVYGPNGNKIHLSGYPWAMFFILGVGSIMYIPHLLFDEFVSNKISKLFKGKCI